MEDKSILKHKKKSKRKKEKHNKKSKKERRKHKVSTSTDNSTASDNCEWVEKVINVSKSEIIDSSEKKNPLEREEWMNLGNLFPGTSKVDKKKLKDEKEKEEEKNTAIFDKPGQSERELNPHWKNGGTGLPEKDKSIEGQNMDVNWLKKSFKRAQEFADQEGKTLEEVAAERWGSLDHIKDMIQKAENNKSMNRKSYKSSYEEKYRRKDQYRNGGVESRYSEKRRRSRSRSKDQSSSYSSKDRYRISSDRGKRSTFTKPGEDDFYSSSVDQNSRRVKNWQKPEFKETSSNRRESPKTSSELFKAEKPIPDELKNEELILTEEEMNQLGAKMVKAEIMGKKDIAAALKLKLETAREYRKKVIANKNEDNVVILTKTDAQGNTRWLNRRCEDGQSGESGKKKLKVGTHESGQRVRYFADDDKYTLQQMYTQEKGRSTREDDAIFTKIMTKKRDMDDVFEEEITRGDSAAKRDERERMQAIKEHKSLSRSLENCHLCIDSQRMQKHTIVTMGNKIYLSLPSYSSLVTGHCILAPIAHVSCQTQLDEDDLEELKIFKNTLTRMFLNTNQVPVFFEVYMNRSKFPHMQVECIPLPQEEGSTAPMYFKKALLECESEWANNKKVVDLSKKDLQKSIPKGLPYFAINFGTDGGFAHIIEDEKLFPKNFAQEIIGGMLDADHSLWRKPRRENLEQLSDKVIKFIDIWNKYENFISHKSK